MPRLSATTTPTDQTRATRLMLAWVNGDKFALDVVLEEVMADPTGVPGLIFIMVETAVGFGEKAYPELFAELLRTRLLDDQDDGGYDL